ncbi:MAG: adenylyltransferase, partial [Endomicrobia bacterium]|nr:adenylyltransferase [Endomicrobiia bacterium]
IHASVLKFYGQATTILPKKGPCYRCIFPQPPQPSATLSCQQEGVLGVVAGFLGIVQATETIKYIVGVGENLVGWLFIFNGLELSCRKIKINKKFNCPVCGKKPFVKDFIDYECFCGIKK